MLVGSVFIYIASPIFHLFYLTNNNIPVKKYIQESNPTFVHFERFIQLFHSCAMRSRYFFVLYNQAPGSLKIVQAFSSSIVSGRQPVSLKIASSPCWEHTVQRW